MKRHWYTNGQVVRTNLVFSAFLLWAAFQVAHLFSLQDPDAFGDYYRERVKKRWNSFEFPEGRRGNIYFRDGSLLAGNKKLARVIAIPAEFTKYEEVSKEIAPLLGYKPEALLADFMSAGQGEMVLAEDVSTDIAKDISKANCQGIFVRYYMRRTYPHRDYGAAATVGYAGKEADLRNGLEATQDGLLTGIQGEQHFRRDGFRKKLPGSLFEVTAPVDGSNLTTTLHPSIQLVCEDEIRKAIATNRAEMGCILVMEPSSGQVIGVATYPTFNPNQYVEGTIGNWYNVIVHRVVEPGSTAKPILAGYALEKGWVNPYTKYDCRKPLKIDGYWITEAEVGHTVGDASGANLHQIIVGSSNKGMAQVSLSIRQDRVYESFEKMGFFHRTGIELPTEWSGIKPFQYVESPESDKHVWPEITLANIGFGQGLSVTPLQLASAYCVIANGGRQVHPTLILDNGGSLETVAASPTPGLDAGQTMLAATATDGSGLEETVVGNSASSQHAREQTRLLSEQTAATVSGWLVDVVNSGTGKSAALDRYQAAGKTGTAQLPSPQGGYMEGAYVANFVGFFPVEQPRYVVLVMFWEPEGEYYGGQVAAPVFKAVGDRISYIDELVSPGGDDAA